ncbi:CDP-diglyceride synthetase [Fructilactobacillus lindneri]|uniref:Phosphatidate cytidylyltransferase n=2 Tax=Fructilactobacillus lindneri TaxID=53444 RepID=A0A0R2JU68_9LACO|nr:phosphatidate cytidylyltransferase [Fructilactobacillus lindneri]ANZ58100.1 CDP-diglyceride synthetase [Fructilactobacillus lindneri]ANZ59421.1 CDP-diglyceride synthetase [Fructilactobacillus lindneri]KRN78917.1 phosphatidate cytidylyltransferase [Fructilactobacillus lindneri DSM 20690 = JCM 11027]POG98795.1 CDP-diglyceride synthetase [Fructilactobacillus lindneri]POH03068.1 CDP-diglyceride synthetase [Fructilactobacillus lindneri]
MKQRILTAVIALIIFIPIILAGGIWIDTAAVVLGLIAMAEIFIMKKRMIISVEALIAFVGVASLIIPANFSGLLPNYLSPSFVFYILIMLLLLATVFSKNKFNFDDAGVYTMAMLYIGFGFHYFIIARQDSLTTLLYALFIVWCTDSGAYFIGKYFGKNKLAKHISPNKTWEGSIGGTLIATIVCTIFVFFFPINGFSTLSMFFITIILSTFGQLGDLVESALKRFYGVKDSGKILPGHGGILDRFDSLLFVLPLLHLFGIV